jgi:methionyl-tRNA synthetase
LNLKEPWKQIKSDPAAAATSIFVALRVIDSLKTLFAPFLPFTCQRLHNDLGYDGDLFGRLYTEELSETERRHLALRYDSAGATGGWAPSQLSPGQSLRAPTALFLKLEPAIADAEIQRMAGGQ